MNDESFKLLAEIVLQHDERMDEMQGLLRSMTRLVMANNGSDPEALRLVSQAEQAEAREELARKERARLRSIFGLEPETPT